MHLVDFGIPVRSGGDFPNLSVEADLETSRAPLRFRLSTLPLPSPGAVCREVPSTSQQHFLLGFPAERDQKPIALEFLPFL